MCQDWLFLLGELIRLRSSGVLGELEPPSAIFFA